MNALTQTRSSPQSNGYTPPADLAMELAKALALVAPITMTSQQQEVWLRAAMDALKGIYASEVEAVSTEVRRTVTRPSQIVPEIARLVAERRAHENRMRALDGPGIEGPPRKIPVMDRRGQPMSEEDTAELNQILENLNASARYRPDGSRYFIEQRGG